MNGSEGQADNRVTVWMVEDNANYRDDIRRVIDAEPDLRCSEVFGSGEDLLTHLNTSFAPEVILVDIGLPGVSGIELIRRLRPVALGTALVMLTIHEDTDSVFQALKEGASGYLAKTATADEVVQGIRDVLTGGATMSPQIARRVLNIFAQLHAPRFDYGLTDRERHVLTELVAGKTKKRIAKDLFLSTHTVDTHLRSIYGKLHVNTQTAAVSKALTEKLIP